MEDRWRYRGGDDLVWMCDCHDCRKRRKHGDIKLAPVRERREDERRRAEDEHGG